MTNLYLENWQSEIFFNPAENFLSEGRKHFKPNVIPKLQFGYFKRWEKKVEPGGQKAILFFSGLYTGIEDYARSYARTHDNSKLISHERTFDEVVNQNAINNLDVANEATVKRVGEKIIHAWEHGYDIILDGYYVDIRDRAPLVNFLNQLKMEVIILVRMHPERFLGEATHRMALNTLLRGKLIKELIEEHTEFTKELNLELLEDSITPYARRHDVSVDELYRKYCITEQFEDYVSSFANTSIRKNDQNGFYDQLKSGIAYCGAKYAFKI